MSLFIFCLSTSAEEPLLIKIPEGISGLCAPARSMLLSGCDHQGAGMGSIMLYTTLTTGV